MVSPPAGSGYGLSCHKQSLSTQPKSLSQTAYDESNDSRRCFIILIRACRESFIYCCNNYIGRLILLSVEEVCSRVTKDIFRHFSPRFAEPSNSEFVNSIRGDIVRESVFRFRDQLSSGTSHLQIVRFRECCDFIDVDVISRHFQLQELKVRGIPYVLTVKLFQ